MICIKNLLYRGVGVDQDFKEAVKWYRLAAEQDLADALTHNLSLYNTYVTETLSLVFIHELYILGYFEPPGGG